MRLAYFGTPLFSAQFLEKILLDKTLPIEIIYVCTQPDKPVGRSKKIIPSPVKVIAQQYQIDVKEHTNSLLPYTKDIDLAVVFAYGKIIKKDLLRATKYGFWNIHPSLLPYYRGASPITYPLILGDGETGLTLMQMDEEMDHGSIIDQEKISIQSYHSKIELENKLLDSGYELFKKNLTILKEKGLSGINSIAQDHHKATYTRQLHKNDGYVDLKILKKALRNEKLNPDELPGIIKDYIDKNSLPQLKASIAHLNSGMIIYNLYRGLHPWPGIWTEIIINGQKKRLKITQIKIENEQLILDKVQLEGKNEVSFEQFNSAYHIF